MLQDKINKDYISAMKQKDTLKAGVLSFLRAQLKNVMIDKKEDALSDEAVIGVIKKQVKQRQDSIEQYEKGGRADLAAKERGEQEVLQQYLPQLMPPEEVQGLIQAAVTETGAKSLKDMGKVMQAVLAKAQGKADNKQVSQLVKQALSQM